MRRGELLWILALLVLGLYVRVIFLALGGGIIDSDEAIVGLMAKHIAEGDGWPIFYYGQPYMGSLEPTLAALLFKLFGVSGLALKAVPVTFSLGMIPLGYLLGKRLSGQFAGRVAALYLAIPPVALIEWGTKARGGFIELVVLGTIALLIVETLLRASIWQKKRLFLLGVVLGLAWWTNNQAIFYIAAVGGALLYQGLRRHGVREILNAALYGGGGFFIGGAPFWYANLTSNPKFQTFKMLSGRATPKEVVQHLGGVFEHSLPILLGAKRFWTADDVLSGGSILALTLLALGLITLFQSRSTLRGVLGTFFFATIAIFSLSSFGWLTQAPRYLLPLYSVFPVLFGGLVAAFHQRSRIAGGVALLSILFLNLSSSYLGEFAIPGQPFVSRGERVSKDHTALYQWLADHRIHHINTNYWIGYRIAFETEEQVTFSMYGEPTQVRIPSYEFDSELLEDWAPVVATPGQAEFLTDSLTRSGFTFKREVVSGYVIVHSISPVTPLGPELDLKRATVRTSHHMEWGKNLIDGSEGSRWGSASPQRPGMSIELRLPEAAKIGNLILEQGFWRHDAVDEVAIALIRRDGSECVLFDGHYAADLTSARGIFRLSFPVEEAAGIRIINLSSHPILDWSIAEIKLFAER